MQMAAYNKFGKTANYIEVSWVEDFIEYVNAKLVGKLPNNLKDK